MCVPSVVFMGLLSDCRSRKLSKPQMLQLFNMFLPRKKSSLHAWTFANLFVSHKNTHEHILVALKIRPSDPFWIHYNKISWKKCFIFIQCTFSLHMVLSNLGVQYNYSTILFKQCEVYKTLLFNNKLLTNTDNIKKVSFF